jgi:plasmid stabilization system protein ParE
VTRLVLFRPEADTEALSARDWYEAQSRGLGAKFADAIAETIDMIAAEPAIFARVHGDVRRAFVRRFPYAIYFYWHDNTIVVLAVMHGHRDPRRWQSRS